MRLNRFSLARGAIFCMLCVCSPSTLATNDSHSAAQVLSQLLSEVDMMQVSFAQQVRDTDNTLLDSSTGWMAWQQPDKLRWEVLEPMQQSILVTGGEYQQYDRDLDQLLIQPLSAEASMLPDLLLNGTAESIAARFEVSELSASSDERGHEDTRVYFQLRPLSDAAIFSKVELVFENRRLIKILIVDELGQHTSFEFSEPSSDTFFEEPLFRLQPAPETDIIYQ